MGNALKMTQWLCKRCKSAHDTESAAEACYNNHVDYKDTVVNNVALHEGSSVYEEGFRFPSILEVKDTKTDVVELYILAKLIRTPSSQPAVAARGVKLES